MPYSDVIDPNTPPATEGIAQGDDRIREFKRALIERMASVMDLTVDPIVVRPNIVKSTMLHTTLGNQLRRILSATQVVPSGTIFPGNTSATYTIALVGCLPNSPGFATLETVNITAGSLMCHAIPGTDIITLYLINPSSVSLTLLVDSTWYAVAMLPLV